jgi:hypothetical protein
MRIKSIILTLLTVTLMFSCMKPRPDKREEFVPPPIPDNFDRNTLPENFDPRDLPDGFDLNNLPAGFDPNNLPEGFDPNDIPEGLPDGFNPANMPDLTKPIAAFTNNKKSKVMGKIPAPLYPIKYRIAVITMESDPRDYLDLENLGGKVIKTLINGETDGNGNFTANLTALTGLNGFYRIILYADFEGKGIYVPIDGDYLCDVDGPAKNPAAYCGIIPIGKFKHTVTPPAPGAPLRGACVVPGQNIPYNILTYFPRGHVSNITISYESVAACAHMESSIQLYVETGDKVSSIFDKWGKIQFPSGYADMTEAQQIDFYTKLQNGQITLPITGAQKTKAIFGTNFTYEGEMNMLYLFHTATSNNLFMIRGLEITYDN